ncbi:FAD-dependent monooxygenase [Frigidibacter sp. RF13]|uniref:FAD-dependent oxidoreductase n=1 Tax=Frigidibacter sp. RF13 TaxID=2997340 RepID=UPI0022702A80|nr:FAD-dependent oxidoreductase [Frigidibacter sp. RF13]MCY1125826.1 FAD-dependent monooxygenase [Frigidibacter sp. RF13]
MIRDRDIAVIGAGIAGLATATALCQRGAKVRVLEQAPVIREVGAGLQITPNGMAVLKALGLEEECDARGQVAEAVELIDGETGALVTRIELASIAPEGSFRFFHRADLIDMLEGASRQAGAAIELGHRIESLTLGAQGPHLLAERGVEHAGLVVGADGLHSRVRAALDQGGKPFFTGQVAWRATLPAAGEIPPVARVYMGPGRHIVTYPLRGGSLRNIVAVEERKKWAEESWNLTDDPLALRIAFEEFIPEVRGWLDRIERPNLWGLFRHPVAEHWHGHGAVLVGDAAHPTLPFLAQGANMALEDAWVLAASLARHPEAEALRQYQAARRDRSKRIVAAASANARNYHLSGVRRDLAHFGLRTLQRFAPGMVADRFAWLYGHDVTRLGTT